MKGKLVIAVNTHPANIVFVVVKAVKGGWLHCNPHSNQDGTPCRSDSIFKFRRSEVRIWKPQT